MTLLLTQSYTAVGFGATSSFLGVGGTGSLTYSVLPGGAGGTVNASTGVYTAPDELTEDPALVYDTVRVTDSLSVTADAQIFIGDPFFLFCEILQKELGLANGRVYVWDQKIMQPTDSGLYIAVSIPVCTVFGNSNRQSDNGLNSEQMASVLAKLDIDIISRGPSARNRRAEVVLALNSTYAQQQQEAFGFYIGKVPPGSQFINLSNVDGAAIPYRYRISVNLQYAQFKTKPVDYYDSNFLDFGIVVDTGQTAVFSLTTEDGDDLLTEGGQNIFA